MRMIARPRRGELGDDPVDLDLGADVDAAGRLVEDQDAGLRSPATWRARPSAGCRRTAPRRPGRRRSSGRGTASRERARERALAPTRGRAAAGTAAAGSAGSRSRRSRSRARGPPGGGPRGRRRCRRPSPRTGSAKPTGLPARRTSPASRWSIPNRTRATSVRPGADEAGHADDLARADREARRPRTRRRATGRRPRAGRRRSAVSTFGNSVTVRPTMCRIRSAVVSSAVGVGDDVLAVAQHGRAVAQVEHLAQAMADEQHRDAAVAQAADDREQPLDLVRRQRRGRLVEDQHPASTDSAFAISISCWSAIDSPRTGAWTSNRTSSCRRTAPGPGGASRPSRRSAAGPPARGR